MISYKAPTGIALQRVVRIRSGYTPKESARNPEIAAARAK